MQKNLSEGAPALPKTQEIDNGIDKTLDKVADFLIEQLVGFLGPDDEKSPPLVVAELFDLQRNVLDTGSFKTQANFIEKSRPFFRDPNHEGAAPLPILDGPKGPSNAQSSDPRVDYARKWVVGVKEALGTSIFDVQYQRSLQDFATARAQKTLGTLPGTQPGLSGTDLNSTKKDPTSSPGVLELAAETDTPADKIRVVKATINGLSEPTRKKLEDTKIGKLVLPLVASVETSSILHVVNLHTFEIGRNEQSVAFFIGGNGDFLKQRAAAIRKGGQGDNLAEDARLVLATDVDTLSIKETAAKKLDGN